MSTLAEDRSPTQPMLKVANPSLSMKTAVSKGAAAAGWSSGAVVTIVLVALASDPGAVQAALEKAGVNAAYATVIGVVLVALARGAANWAANRQVQASPVDGEAVDHKAAETPPIMSTEAQMLTFIQSYGQLMSKGVPFDEARRLALQDVIGRKP